MYVHPFWPFNLHPALATCASALLSPPYHRRPNPCLPHSSPDAEVSFPHPTPHYSNLVALRRSPVSFFLPPSFRPIALVATSLFPGIHRIGFSSYIHTSPTEDTYTHIHTYRRTYVHTYIHHGRPHRLLPLQLHLPRRPGHGRGFRAGRNGGSGVCAEWGEGYYCE